MKLLACKYLSLYTSWGGAINSVSVILCRHRKSYRISMLTISLGGRKRWVICRSLDRILRLSSPEDEQRQPVCRTVNRRRVALNWMHGDNSGWHTCGVDWLCVVTVSCVVKRAPAD